MKFQLFKKIKKKYLNDYPILNKGQEHKSNKYL